MASAAKRRSFDTYRNLSYAYDGSAARELEEEEVLSPLPQVRPRRKAVTRPRVQVREAGRAAPFAIVGFAAAAALAVLIIMSYVQLYAVSNEVVGLNSQMTALQSAEASLQAQYEQAYDLNSIEKQVTADGSMSRPQSGQIVYVDLTEPDNVQVYDQGEAKNGFLEGVKEIVNNILSYF